MIGIVQQQTDPNLTDLVELKMWNGRREVDKLVGAGEEEAIFLVDQWKNFIIPLLL
jgi:hypothetical protein